MSLLIIKSNNKIPDKDILLFEIEQVQNEMYRELMLDDWGKGSTAKEVYGSAT